MMVGEEVIWRQCLTYVVSVALLLSYQNLAVELVTYCTIKLYTPNFQARTRIPPAYEVLTRKHCGQAVLCVCVYLFLGQGSYWISSAPFTVW